MAIVEKLRLDEPMGISFNLKIKTRRNNNFGKIQDKNYDFFFVFCQFWAYIIILMPPYRVGMYPYI